MNQGSTCSVDASRVAAIVALATLVVRLAVALHIGSAMQSFDVWNYWILGRIRGRPYVDYAAEYPFATLALFKSYAFLAPSRIGFGRVVVWSNLVADLGIAALVCWAWGRAAAAFYLIVGVILTPLAYARVDMVSTMLATAGVACWFRRRDAAGGALVGLAAMTKLWPAVLLPLGTASTPRRWRFTIAALPVVFLAGASWVAVGGVDGVREVLTYRGARGWELNTIPGVILLALHPTSAFQSGGATRIGEVAMVVRLLMPIAATSIALWGIVVSTRLGRIGSGWLLGVAALMVLSPLLSPQFLVWLLPAAAIAWVEGERIAPLLFAGSASLTALEMARWEWVLEARPGWLLLVGIRDALLVGVFLASAFSLFRHERRERLGSQRNRSEARLDATLVAG